VGRLLRLLLITGLVTGTVLLLMAGPLRRWLTPPPVAGLNARLSADGRLFLPVNPIEGPAELDAAKLFPNATGFFDPTLLQLPDGSLLISDEQLGAIYRITYAGK
jgi:hypothetical protein